jgi:hypothetical protein
MSERVTYPPLNTLKPIAEDVWIVDGPAIHFGPSWLKMPFPTRMAVIRIGSDLFVHSPTALTPSLGFESARLGTPRWIVGPSRIHYWWIPDWHAAFPAAEVYLAPKIREQSKGRIDFPAHDLDRTSGYPWDGAIETLPVEGSYMTEVVFFHRPSRTLVLTDFIENFEREKLGSFMRWLTRLGGANGSMPRDMRMSYRNKKALRQAVEMMIAWDPERIVLAHGRWYERDGAAELKRAFSWLLKS